MKKVVGKLKKLSLITKITSSVTLILIIPMLVVCFFYFRVFQNSLLNDAHNKLTENLNEVKMEMETNLDMVESVSNELNYLQEFAYFLDAGNVLSNKEQMFYISNVQKELINIRYLYPNKFYYIAIYSSNNQINDKFDRQYSINELKEKPYYEAIINSPDKISYGQVRDSEFKTSNIALNPDNLNLNRSGTLVLPAYLKVHNLSTKDIVGIIELDIQVGKLMDKGNGHSVENGLTYLLLDRQNHIVYQTGKFKDTDFMKVNFDNQSGSLDVDIENKTYMMDYDRCGRTGLMRGVIIAKENVLSFANNLMIKVILIALVSMCIVVFTIHWILRKMLKRLLVLDSKMAEIESGKFDVAIKDNGEDEISRISRSFNSMASQLKAVISSAIEKEKAQKDAELRALQAQINPHFLYNTLENMRMQCEIDEYYTIGDGLAVLGDLFRYSIKWGSNEVAFNLEWTNLKNYIAIMQMRFEDDVACILECEEGLENIIVPKLMLQPLVENCFNHGLHNQLPPWKIKVRAFKEDNKLLIVIEDNGCGMDRERLKKIRKCMMENTPIEDSEKARSSIGIINVKQRIDRICKAGSGIEIDSEAGVGTKIVIAIVPEEA